MLKDSDIQRQNGVLFIDFGAEVTSYAVYKDGLPRLVSVLPIGGKHVTQDIACRFLIDVDVAERLKPRRARWHNARLPANAGRPRLR